MNNSTAPTLPDATPAPQMEIWYAHGQGEKQLAAVSGPRKRLHPLLTEGPVRFFIPVPVAAARPEGQIKVSDDGVALSRYFMEHGLPPLYARSGGTQARPVLEVRTTDMRAGQTLYCFSARLPLWNADLAELLASAESCVLSSNAGAPECFVYGDHAYLRTSHHPDLEQGMLFTYLQVPRSSLTLAVDAVLARPALYRPDGQVSLTRTTQVSFAQA